MHRKMTVNLLDSEASKDLLLSVLNEYSNDEIIELLNIFGKENPWLNCKVMSIIHKYLRISGDIVRIGDICSIIKILVNKIAENRNIASDVIRFD